MFKRTGVPSDASVSFTFDGKALTAKSGDSVASALLAAGETVFRASQISGVERGPFCMMGVCFECLVEVDGVFNRQACMLTVVEGMTVRRQRRSSEEDFNDLL
jgi:predicted molibdopterin-dependent oxidoreductase YjgC